MRHHHELCIPLLLVSSLVATTGCSDEDAVACIPEEQPEFFSTPADTAPPQPESLVISTELEDPNIINTTVVLVVALDNDLNDRLLFGAVDAGAVSVDENGAPRILIETRPGRVASVTVNGLSPSTTYYYRFYYADGEACRASAATEIRTADPTP